MMILDADSLAAMGQRLDEQRRALSSLMRPCSSGWEVDDSERSNVRYLIHLFLVFCSSIWYEFPKLFDVLLSNDLICSKDLDVAAFFWLPWIQLVKLKATSKLVYSHVLISILVCIVWIYVKDACIGDKGWVPPDTDCCGLGLPPKRLSLSLDIVTRCDIGWCYGWQLLLENLGDLRWVPPGVGVYSGMLGKLECSPLTLAVHRECLSPEWKCVALVDYIKLGKALSFGCLLWLPSLHAATIWMVYAALMGKCSKDWVAQPPPPFELILAEDLLSARKCFLCFCFVLTVIRLRCLFSHLLFLFLIWIFLY